MKVHGTRCELMGHLTYSVHKFSILGVYEYDIYISVPPSHGKCIEALHRKPRNVYCVAVENENIGISFLSNMLTYVVY